MSNSRIAFRKVLIGAASGLAGGVVGGAVARIAVEEFDGSPAWQLPAIVVGALAVAIVAVLLIPEFIGQRRIAEHRDP